MFCAHYYDERCTRFSIKDFFVVFNAIRGTKLFNTDTKGLQSSTHNPEECCVCGGEALKTSRHSLQLKLL